MMGCFSSNAMFPTIGDLFTLFQSMQNVIFENISICDEGLGGCNRILRAFFEILGEPRK